jgi:ligand-binding sensor domain-containing protein/putative methionine-R-sulfoxide reductase with GAF domain
LEYSQITEPETRNLEPETVQKTHKTGRLLIFPPIYTSISEPAGQKGIFIRSKSFVLTNTCYKNIIGLLLACLLLVQAHAQPPSFYHISTANGLSANEVRNVTIDKNGFLWIGTEEGLNVYNGNSISIYLKERQPALPSNIITNLFCDSRDRIWVNTTEGMVMLDEERRFSNVVLQDTLIKFACRAILETKSNGVLLITSAGNFSCDETKKKFQPVDTPSGITFRRTRMVQPFGDNKAIYVTDSLLGIYDFSSKKFIYERIGKTMISACQLNDKTIAVGNSDGKVEFIDIASAQTTWTCVLRNEIGDEKINPIPSQIKKASNGDLVINTRLDGIIIINQQRQVYSCVHDPMKPQSVISNYIDFVYTGSHGEVIVGGSTSGVSLYNTTQRTAQFNSFFMDQKGDYYDNYTGRMIEDKTGMIWISAYDRLIKWDKQSNRSTFFYYYIPNQNTVRRGDIRALCFDRSGQLWVSINGIGIALLNQHTGTFKDVKLDTTLGRVLQSRFISDMILDNDGLIWVSCMRGFYTIDPVTRKVNTFSNDSLFKVLDGVRVNSCRQDKQGRIWICSNGKGVFCYDKQKRQLTQYSTKEGLTSDLSYMTDGDSKGRVYVAAATGFNVIYPDGHIKPYTRGTGLRYERTESVAVDNEDIAWFTNKKILVKLDLDSNKLEFFDEKARILNEGFRVGSNLRTSKGELLWGGYRGVSYYLPDELKNNNAHLRLNIYQAMLRDSLVAINASEKISMSYADNSVIFRYAAVHLGIPGKTYYQYMLEGFDPGWQREEDLGQARYTSLSPGVYTFRVKASMDGVNWVESANTVTLRIIPPFWRRWWFFAVLAILISGSLSWLIDSRNRKIRKQKEELEAEQAINYFATSMNEQPDVDDILWDVAKNCIGRLHFEDCVIYLYQTQRQMLVQRAAHGPKSSRYYQIDNPLEIPIGKGIVGAVAASGKAEIIPDTTKDERYIVDDERRFSEIAVPIISGTTVLGVIDCEHSKKGFFTQKHLFILTTIASLCANKIVRARAEEEKQRAQKTLMDTQQKMAEVKMQALRAQMNPHFIFNCLNSINRYIVKSDQATASLYLTRFAKLIRLILDNSNSKNVILSNELEALKLYIEMEALRFDKKFHHEIIVDDEVSLDGIEVPPLIIQPYVENAIWHGLLHKEGDGSLRIHISMAGENLLQCEIEDNGVGRDKARELKSKSATSRKSLGMKLTEDRIALLNQHAEMNASIDIIDLKESGESVGTRVILKIPV